MSADDDPLMELLGDAAREREPDPRWEEHARGRLSPEELEALRATTASDEEWAMLEAVFRPLSEHELATDVDRTLDRIAMEAPAPARRLSRGRVRFAAVGAVVLAAAAAALLVLWPSDPPPTPRYALHLTGGAQAMRGSPAPDSVPRFRSGSRIEIVLQPEVRADASVSVATFARGAGGVRRVRADWERASSGAFRLAGEAAQQLDLPDGVWTLIVVVGPTDRLPAHAADAVRQARADASFRVLEAPIRLELGR